MENNDEFIEKINFTDLTQYPVGTKVKNREGEIGEITEQRKHGEYPVIVSFKKYTTSYTRTGMFFIRTSPHPKDIVKILEVFGMSFPLEQTIGEMQFDLDKDLDTEETDNPPNAELKRAASDYLKNHNFLPPRFIPKYILTIIDLDGQVDVISTCVEPKVLLDNHLLHYTKNVGELDEVDVYLSLDEVKQIRIQKSPLRN